MKKKEMIEEDAESNLDSLLCEFRADSFLQDTLGHQPNDRWTAKETNLLVKLIRSTSNLKSRVNWKEVLENMPGLSIQRVKNRYYYLIYKEKRQMRKKIKFYLNLLYPASKP